MSMTKLPDQESQIKDPATALKEILERESRVLREMLSSMENEREAILSDKKELLKTIMNERESLIELLYKLRSQRIQNIKKMIEVKSDKYELSEKISLEHGLNQLIDYMGDEACEILSLKEEVIALLAKMKDLSEGNNYLLKNKIAFTKKLINTIHPTENKNAYSGSGQYKKQLQTKTMTIINREV